MSLIDLIVKLSFFMLFFFQIKLSFLIFFLLTMFPDKILLYKKLYKKMDQFSWFGVGHCMANSIFFQHPKENVQVFIKSFLSQILEKSKIALEIKNSKHFWPHPKSQEGFLLTSYLLYRPSKLDTIHQFFENLVNLNKTNLNRDNQPLVFLPY